MRNVILIAAMLLLVPGAARAQDITIPQSIERLSGKAVETVNVTVDGALLQLAAKFLSADDPDQRVAKNLISNLKGVYVRSYQFANAGEYSEADLESVRSQLKAPAWSRMASVRSQREGEDVDVFFKMETERIAGLVVIAAQPRQLTVVNIAGQIDLDQLARLGGQLGIPKLDIERARK
jgi:hypothetical protein